MCPRYLTQHQVEGWLREAIRRGAVGAYWEGDFPRYVWFKAGESVYQGRLVNSGLGEYKGWPLSRAEWPAGIERFYE